MRTRFASMIALLAVALLVLAPAAALAAGDEPDEMVDPPAAMEPEVNEPDMPVVEDQDAGVAAEASQDGTAEVAGAAASGGSAAPAPTVGATNPQPIGGGSLPFTGVADGRIVLLLLVGSLLVSAGATAWAAGRTELAAR